MYLANFNMATFVCSIIPQKIVSQNNVSQASILFCKKIVDFNYFQKVISLVPVTVPKNIQKVQEDKVVYIQSRIFKHILWGRYLNVFIETLLAARCCISEKNIWFYNLNNQNILLYILLRYFMRKKVFVLLADFTPPKYFFSLSTFMQYMIKQSYGILSLSERTNIRHVNFVSLPGIVTSIPDINVNNVHLIDKSTFLFSGYLGEVTGIELALKYFSKHPQFLLYVTGRGNLEREVQKYASMYHNIVYLGFLEYDDYINWLSKIDFCLNFRNPLLSENSNNFPSKILEYFTYGKIVISTIMYPELEGLNYFYISYSEDDFNRLMGEIESLSYDKLVRYTNHAKTLELRFSKRAWKNAFQKIENFYC